MIIALMNLACYLDSGDVIRGHESNLTFSINDMPPVPLFGVALLEEEKLAFREAESFGQCCLKVVQRFKHLMVFCKYS